MDAPLPPLADDKDWTWVLTRLCPECGFDAAAITGAQVPQLTRTAVAELAAATERRDARQRPEPQTWSALEYACHVRDVCRIFDERLRRMLTEPDPLFANWDQDETALAERYWAQDPSVVRAELNEAGERIAATFEAVPEQDWSRPGRRSNGSEFTVDSFSRYFVHDLLHHAHDVRA